MQSENKVPFLSFGFIWFALLSQIACIFFLWTEYTYIKGRIDEISKTIDPVGMGVIYEKVTWLEHNILEDYSYGNKNLKTEEGGKGATKG